MQVVLPDPNWTIGKHALMNLHAVRRNGRTEIDPRSWRIPYQWQGCHYQDHDDQPFLLLINSGGGFVEGDVAELHGTFEPGTRALVTTTAASKFYKCPEGRTSREEATLRVLGDALLEYIPDESIPFARSRVERRTRIEVDRTARLFATDMVSAGRIAYGEGETFQFDALDSSFEVVIDGETMALDRMIAEDPDEIAALRRLWQGAYHSVTVFGYAADLPAGIEEAVEAALEPLPLVSAGASRMGDLVVCRILAGEAWHCHDAILAAWSVLRPAIAGKPARPIRKC
jgi:urease accessory protein